MTWYGPNGKKWPPDPVLPPKPLTAREQFKKSYRKGEPVDAERLEQIYALITQGGCLCGHFESCSRCSSESYPLFDALRDLLATVDPEAAYET